MATPGSSHLEAIDKKFCQCSICLEQYREPKLLQCLHRYCSDCLKQLIERNQEIAVISCPECRIEVKIPTEGVDGFKTDFYMKNIIEYIQIQKSAEHEQLLECSDCSSIVAVKAYCFKCNGFLCTGCHNHHVTKRSLQDHKQHTLSLEDLKSKNMTLEKLTDLKEAPRCHSHLKDLCLLCCRTCDDLPICVACVLGIHKNHQIDDVKMVAAEEREKLQIELTNLDQNKDQMLKMTQKAQRVKGDVIATFKERKKNFATRYESDMKIVKREIEQIENDFKHSQTEIENSTERELTETKAQMDEEIKQMKIKYAKILDEIKDQSKIKLDSLREKKEEKLQDRREQLAVLEGELRRFMDSSAKKQEETITNLEKLSRHIDGIMGRHKTLNANGVRVLETRSDWTAVQCIPDIRKAIELLRDDIQEEFPEINRLLGVRDGFIIEEDDNSPVNVEGTETDSGWKIGGITSASGAKIVISGSAPDIYYSHITVTNMNGKVLHRKELKGNHPQAYRYCSILSEFKVATTCKIDEVGVFDLRHNSYITANIRDFSSLATNRGVTCVTTDPVSNYILVGHAANRDIYVFDGQLNYQYTLTLPDLIMWPRDMAVSEGKLIVCDFDGKRTCIISMEGSRGNLTQELTKPTHCGDDWGPLSVCTDSTGLIYVLWKTDKISAPKRTVIVQYREDGSQSLTQKVIDNNDARCIAAVKINSKTEKLVVGCLESSKLHIYTLKTKE